jgi:hypothetical protein
MATENTGPEAPAPEGTRFPFIKLESALARAKQLFGAAAEHPVTVPDAFVTWKYSEKSSGGNQTVSALKMYGLLGDSGNNEQRRVFLTPKGLRYFRDEREEVLAELKREFALAPPLMRTLWNKWGVTPPADNIARSYLKIDLKMSDQNARSALGVYKENLDYAGLKAGDKVAEISVDPAAQGGVGSKGSRTPPPPPPPPPPIPPRREVQVMAGERELTTGLLSKEATFRLIVSGPVGVKEIERLIAKLELDKEILAEQGEETEPASDPQKPKIKLI